MSIADNLFQRRHSVEYTQLTPLTLSKVITSIMMIIVIIASSTMVIITMEGTRSMNASQGVAPTTALAAFPTFVSNQVS